MNNNPINRSYLKVTLSKVFSLGRAVAALMIAVMSVPAVNASRAGDVTTYALNVSDFTELKVTDNISVIHRTVPDSVGTAVFRADPNQAAAILFEPNGAKLTIQKDSESTVTELPVVIVYSSFLSKVENSGTGTVRVESPASGAKFSATVIGNGSLIVNNLNHVNVDASIKTGKGSLIVNGKCTNARLLDAGTGQIQADGLEADMVKCSLWGTGSVGCVARRKLNIGGAGSGTVYYIGEPEIKSHSIGVKAEPLNK